jgi:opacity protein-like surface antigen
VKRLFIAALLLSAMSIAQATDLPKVVLGDYDAELRGADGRVDIPLMIQRLTDLGANTYFWLIWHQPTDWEDLQLFLPEAAKANLQVWAYICPPSEQGGRWPYSEPFRRDFVKWAEEIAKLSLQYPNLVGWVIDDFWANFRETVISPDMVRQMQGTAKAINPDLRFYPLMYFHQFGPPFAQNLAPLVDGVVAAYHQGPEEIEQAVKVLSDDVLKPAGCWITFPFGTPSRPGDFASASQAAKVVEPNTACVSFRYQDDYDGPTGGYHVMQLRVNDKVVWSQDVAGHDEGRALVELQEFVGNNVQVQLTWGVFDLKGVSQYGVEVSFRDLRVTGLQMETADLGDASGWFRDRRGAFEIECRKEQPGQHAFKLPLIVMPAGSRGEYKHRYHEDATPENIAARTRQALELMGDGRVIGTVMYCLDKTKTSADLPAIRKLYDEFCSHSRRQP